jgi:hypothetical protein
MGPGGMDFECFAIQSTTRMFHLNGPSLQVPHKPKFNVFRVLRTIPSIPAMLWATFSLGVTSGSVSRLYAAGSWNHLLPPAVIHSFM